MHDEVQRLRLHYITLHNVSHRPISFFTHSFQYTRSGPSHATLQPFHGQQRKHPSPEPTESQAP